MLTPPSSAARHLAAAATALAVVTAAALAAANPAAPALAGTPVTDWQKLVRVDGAVDLAGPRADGRFALAAGGRLFTLAPDGTGPEPFARGRRGYRSAAGEPYIAYGPASATYEEGCPFSDSLFALEPRDEPGLVRISPGGRARRFASFPDGTFLSGIAFDRVGSFGDRLLVVALTERKTKAALYAFDCGGRRERVATGAPRVEGGIEVAPESFGAFGGDLIAVDERKGKVYAFDPDGAVTTLARPGLPRGGDTGVESLGFVPPGFAPPARALMADLGVKRGVGTDSVLALDAAALTGAGVLPGDLLVATETGAETVRVRCTGAGCETALVASGPARAHAEGHIVFTGAG
ncbi:MAG TPA: hypothetical protein VFY99_06030 [Solirubrobacterales bacterium]